MQADFDPAFDALMGVEKRYVNNPNDPGGATCWGITERVARASGYIGDMHDLPIEFAKEIAKKRYWDTVQGDQLPQELAFQVFDAAYNSGPTEAVAWLQHAAKVPVNGHLNPATMAAVASADIDKLVMRFDAYRLLFLAGLPKWPHFAGGWAKRIANNLLRAAG